MPTDASLDEDDAPPGTDAPLGVMFGDPSRADLMIRQSIHKRRLIMIAPNSTAVPGHLLSSAARLATGLLSPSQWGANVLRNLMKIGMPEEDHVPVSVLPHGVGEAFDPSRLSPGRIPDRSLRVLHVTSTASSRKSTLELAQAFHTVASEGGMGPQPELCIECDPVSYSHWRSELHDKGLTRWVRIFGAKVTPWEKMGEHLREFDCVCQPSRAEGFGLLPLEALCAGVPIIATTCTGHSEFLGGYLFKEWAADTGYSVVRVPHGDLEDMGDDVDGAMAPEVRMDSIASALTDAFRFRETLHVSARTSAQTMYNRWSWKTVSKIFLDRQAAELGDIS